MLPVEYMVPCLMRPMGSSIVFGGIFTGIESLTGGGPLTLNRWGQYSGFIYVYNIIQCPLEVIHGRQSALHNVIAGASMGYIGTTRFGFGVPFVSPYFLYGSRSPGLISAAVYGGMAGCFATLGGKPW